MLFKQELLQEFMPANKNYEDYSILPHWFHNVKQVVYTNQPLYHYRLRKSSIVHNLSLKDIMNSFKQKFQDTIITSILPSRRWQKNGRQTRH